MTTNEILMKSFDNNYKQYKLALNVLSLFEGMSIKETEEFILNLRYFLNRVPMEFNLKDEL